MTFDYESDALPERERLRIVSGQSSAHVVAHRFRLREGTILLTHRSCLAQDSLVVELGKTLTSNK